jgi:mannose-6-phosphate isomerase-like protein (cupin superfamily)
MSAKGFRVRLRDVPGVSLPNQTHLQMAVHPEVTGATLEASVSLFVITYPPGVSSPQHTHVSDEYEYVLSGTGILDSGNEKGIPLEPDTVAHNPKGILHQVTNTGKEPLRVLKIHVPPARPYGPEDVYTEKAIDAAKKAFK